MKIGYSYWGFLTGTAVDTPDGGRFFRPIFIEEMLKRDWKVICLQENRESIQRTCYIEKKGRIYGPIYSSEFPDIDLLILEWRWPIPGRNTELDKEKKAKGYTPDLERQKKLLEEYTKKRKTITLIWDHDRQMTEKEKFELEDYNVIFAEPVFFPRAGFEILNFPIDFKKMDEIKPNGNYNRQYMMGFIWNNWKKDYQIRKYLNPVANLFSGKIHFWGNWTKYPKKFPGIKRKFPDIVFHNRISYNEAIDLYKQFGSTAYLTSKKAAEEAHISPRFLEIIFYKRPVFLPAEFRKADSLLPPRNIITDKYDLIYQLLCLKKMTSKQRIRFIENQTEKFLENKEFFVEKVVNKIENLVSKIKKLVAERKLRRRIFRTRDNI